MSYIPTGRNNQCIHCGDKKRKCRTHKTREMHLCAGLAGLRKGETSQGYVIIGDDPTGRWAQLLPDNRDWSDEQKREWETRRLQEQQQAKEEKRRRKERALTPQKRHELYTKLFREFSLDQPTLDDLLRRGFSPEEIKACGFKSIVAGQKLSIPFDRKLPGIGLDGRSLATKYDGYICPIYDVDGNIVSYQIRLHNPPDGNRYRWGSTPNTATLQVYPEGENPLTVLRPEVKPQGIALAEGCGAKVFLVSRRLGMVVIGSPGGQWASSIKTFKLSLDRVHQEVGGEKVITLYPDAGDVCNRDVTRRWKKVTNILVDWGWKVQFAWWGQSVKGLPDVDELQPGELGRIQYLSTKEFKALCLKWGGLEEKTAPKPTLINYEERVAEAQRRLHSLDYPIDLVCDPTQKYLPNLVGRIPTKGIVGLKSPKGSGKSYQIKLIKDYLCGYWEEVIEEVEEAPANSPQQLQLLKDKPTTVVEAPKPKTKKVWCKGKGMRFLSINARIALGREQAIRWEFTWIEDADIDGLDEFAGQKIAKVAVIEQIDGIGLCWDSLGKVFGRDWSNTLVVIDEIELGLNHVATSSTCRDRRSFILHTLEQKLKECLDNDGLVLVADADLSNVSLDYLTTIAPGYPPYIVGHDFKGDPWEIDFYTGKRDVVLSQIQEWLSDKDCRPIAVAIDNQKEAESLSMFLLGKYPWLSQEIGGLIRIDSKVTQTDFGKDFVKRPNENIQKYKPKVLIYTPSLGVGCSIDIEYFACLFGLFFGNLEPSQARQMLGRPRKPIPRIVWAKERGTTVENEPTSYLPQEIKNRMFNYHNGMMLIMQVALTEARESSSDNPTDLELWSKMKDLVDSMIGQDGTWSNPHIDLYCDQTARRNFALSQFAVQLRQELVDEGHIVKDCSANGATNAGEAVTAGKEEVKRRNATLTATAKDISYEEAQEVRRKPSRTDEEEHAVTKAFMKHDLPGVELTPDFVFKAKYEDNGRWLTQTKLFWHVYNLDACKDKDQREWNYRLSQFTKGVVFLPDIKADLPKVEAILKSGVLDWVKPDNLETEYSNSSPEGQAFVRNAYANRKTIKTALNITVQRDSEPIKLANRILARIGLGLAYSRRDETKGSDRIRYYKLSEELAIDPDRQAVFEALSQRWSERKQKMAESKAQQNSQRPQNDDDFLYKLDQSGGKKQPEELAKNHVSQETTKEQNKQQVTEPEELPEEWRNEEAIASLAQDLQDCDQEMLGLYRECNIPKKAFQMACNLLPPEKYQQIKQWVIEQNAA